MTGPHRLSDALDDVWAAYAAGSWRTDPDRALRRVQERTDRLRALAAQVDPEAWPPGVAAYLWRLPERLE